MTSQVKVQVVASDGNNDTVKYTIGYLNPTATDAVLRTFAQKLNALSNNTFVAVYKTTVLDITGD